MTVEHVYMIYDVCRMLTSPIDIIFLQITGFLDGYTFHGDPHKVFDDFFGCNNPFKGLSLSLSVYSTYM